MSSPMSEVAHRPYPPPASPWVMSQVWHDLLFMHWPVSVEELRSAVPPQLPIETFQGQAYIAVVPFRMSGVRPRFVPSVPGLSAFPELNVRTYVNIHGKRGVYFFSLEAGSAFAVRIARTLFHLPYMDARMSLTEPDGTNGTNGTGRWIHYRSERTHRGERPAELRARYRTIGPVEPAAPGSLEEWLTERYCMYPVDARGQVYRGEIHHPQWPLQRAEVVLESCTMTEPLGVKLVGPPPLVHFSRRLDVVVWPLKKITV